MQKNKRNADTAEKNRATLLRLLLLIVVTMTVFSVYRFLLDRMYFEITLGIYMTVSSALILIYVIYNRGMSRRKLTEDMLPDDWSREKKQEFIADGEIGRAHV